MLPCLVALSLDCDANIAQLQKLGRLPALLHYLDYSVRAREVYVQQQARKRVAEPTTNTNTSCSSVNMGIVTEEAQHVHRLSHLIPADLWAIALVTLSQRTPPS